MPIYIYLAAVMHQNRRLFDLATKNAQRREADEFIEALPAGLQAVFRNAERNYHPSLSGVFAPIIHKASELQQIGNQSKAGLSVLMTASQEKAVAAFLRSVQVLPAGEYLVVPGPGNGIVFSGEGAWVSELPGFLIQQTQFREVAQLVSEGLVNEVAIASLDNRVALVLEVSGGFLADEPSVREEIYEFTAWGMYLD